MFDFGFEEASFVLLSLLCGYEALKSCLDKSASPIGVTGHRKVRLMR